MWRERSDITEGEVGKRDGVVEKEVASKRQVAEITMQTENLNK